MSEAVEAVVVRDSSTLVALERASIDQQISTAKSYPRSLSTFKENVLSFATLDQETAEAMTYAIPRDGKLVEGPSVRLAEIAGSCWGNVRYGARVIEVGDDFLVARGMCYDLERNTAIEIDVRRSITGKRGRFNDNMIQVVGQAACAIALRNAIFKVIPMAFIKPAWEQAKKVAAGEQKTLAARRDAALAWFKEKNVKSEQVFGLLGVQGKDDFNLTHLQQLTAMRTAIKDGESTLEDFFKNPTTTVPVADLSMPFVDATLVQAEDDKAPSTIKPETAVGPQEKPTVVPVEKADKPKKKSKDEEDLDALFAK